MQAAGGRGGRAARIRRRRSAVLAGMGALTVVGVGLAVTGLSNVRSSTVGRYEEVVGSDEPGHQAYVVPTPTMGVLHRDAGGELVGTALLALEPGDDGGAVIVVPPATVVRPTEGGATLADVYGDEGAAAAAQALGLVVTAAVTEHVELDDDLWAQLVEPAGTVELRLDQGVGRWDAGDVTLEPADVGPFLAARGETESDLARLERQQAFWSAWLPLVEGGGEDALPGEASSGIGRFLRGVAHGATVAGLPVGRDDSADEVRLVPDAALLGDLVAQVVPYPEAPEPGGRVRVRLLSGTGDADQAAAAARSLVAGGAEIVIVGNAPTFDVAETTLVPSDPEREPLAGWLQATVVDGRIEEAADGLDGIPPDEEIDVTVILGQDAGDLMRR
ncbi:MAG TPA: LytR C-terminal domain-containing protein [Acidimicrobiales bacterium]